MDVSGLCSQHSMCSDGQYAAFNVNKIHISKTYILFPIKNIQTTHYSNKITSQKIKIARKLLFRVNTKWEDNSSLWPAMGCGPYLIGPCGWKCRLSQPDFTFQPVLHDWCNKGRGMCNPVCGMVLPLLLIGKSSPCGGSGFPLSL